MLVVTALVCVVLCNPSNAQEEAEMPTDTFATVQGIPSDAQDTVQISAHRREVRKLGHWTTATRFDVRASRGSVVLELRSPLIPAGDLEVRLDIDHAMLKLLVPDGAVVDHDDVRRVGRCGFVDWSGTPAPGGRRIRITGEMRSSELRVNRGGIAIVSAMLTREYLDDLRRAFRETRAGSLEDVQRAYREGRWTTIEDPGRLASTRS